MSRLPGCHVIVAASAAARLAAARDSIRAALEPPPDAPGVRRVVVIAASRGAADDLVRTVAAERAGTAGIERLSLDQFAARTAIVSLAAEGATPGAWLASEVVAARAVFKTSRDSGLGYFEPVASTPGFPRAVARTMHELRLARVDRAALGALPAGGPALQVLFDHFAGGFDEAGAVDRARLLEVAGDRLEAQPLRAHVVLLDVPIDSAATARLVRALLVGAVSACVTVPIGDDRARDALKEMGADEDLNDDATRTALDRVRRFLFSDDGAPAEAELDRSVQLFSAPGEGREAVEIARRILAEARTGVRFDDMAVLVRSPVGYTGLIEHALARGGIPAWFDRGTRRPHPAGRAFLALLACAAEGLSAVRFAEYLSLAQVPDGGGKVVEAPAADQGKAAWVDGRDDPFGRVAAASGGGESEETGGDGPAAYPDANTAAHLGTLSAPWRWERLLVEASVVGGDASRWCRRLDGAAAALESQQGEAIRQGGADGARARGLRHARAQLAHFQRFAVPVIEALAAWPARASWGEWLDHFELIVPTVLRQSARVLAVLADLRPMAAVGPIALDEARRVLADRLLTLEADPPARRFGRVFVGTPEQARGRAFRVVFVPGLAERVFPQKPREDPLLLDAQRLRIDAPLAVQHERLRDERRLLQLAVGAAAERLYVSYPRIDLNESRARVPSFYALDLMRAATGRVLAHEHLEDLARETGRALLGWPAPEDPVEAIDEQEHDLAVLRRLLDSEPGSVRGHAHYLLKLNDALHRSVVARWARGERRWSSYDGLIRVADTTREALSVQRLHARAYSLSALQRFSACPYQFLLSAIYRLQPQEQPEPLQRLNPLLRGSIFHDVQARFFRAMAAAHALPVTGANVGDARVALDRTIEEVAVEQHDRLAPAVERVWVADMASIGRDLHGWLDRLAADGEEWEPAYFEFAFGRVPGERDPRSQSDDVTLGDGFRLRGAVDLIEEHRRSKVLRVTDHKTGRQPDRIDKVIVGGGAVLQPVLYGMAVAEALGRPVESSRLSYCTAAGGFSAHAVPVSDRTRETGLEVLTIIDRAVESGNLAAAPTADACARCDFRIVCGPDVGRRVSRKPQDRLADLAALRSLT